MSKVLFIVRGYEPDISASGNLLKPIIEVAKKNHDITILCTSQYYKEELYDGVKIIRLAHINNEQNIINKIKRQFSTNYFYNEILDEIRINIEKLYAIEKYDALISVTYEESLALADTVIDKSKKYHFQLEKLPIYTSLKIPIIYENKMKNKELKEKKIVQSFNKIFCLPTVYKDYYSKGFENIVMVEHPMVVNKIVKSNTVDNNIRIIYGGGLDKKQRNPMQILLLFKKINNIFPIKLDFYSYNNIEKDLINFSKKNPFFDFNLPISKEDFYKEIELSNFIITIGNKESDIFPSKLFDCISTGLPIIHFSQNDSDIYYDYLKNYSNSMIINIQEISTDTVFEDIITFIKSRHNVKSSFSIIEKLYMECTPEYVWNKMITEIRKS